MSKVITLIKKNGNAKEDFNHRVEEIEILQFFRLLKLFKGILATAQNEDSIRQTIVSLIESTQFTEALQTEGLSEEKRAEIEAAEEEADQVFMTSAMKAFEILLTELPDFTFEFLSIAANIDEKTLGQQKLSSLFDIYEAILESNDVMALVERAKKSLHATSQIVNFKNFAQKVTAGITH